MQVSGHDFFMISLLVHATPLIWGLLLMHRSKKGVVLHLWVWMFNFEGKRRGVPFVPNPDIIQNTKNWKQSWSWEGRGRPWIFEVNQPLKLFSFCMLLWYKHLNWELDFTSVRWQVCSWCNAICLPQGSKGCRSTGWRDKSNRTNFWRLPSFEGSFSTILVIPYVCVFIELVLILQTQSNYNFCFVVMVLSWLGCQIKCMKCLGKSERYERMMDLTVEIDGDIGSLEEALAQFTAREILDGENKYHCIRFVAF